MLGGKDTLAGIKVTPRHPFAEPRPRGAHIDDRGQALTQEDEILLTTLPDNAAVGEAQLLHAINKAQTQSAKMFELRATVSLAKQLGATDRNAEAQDLLAPIYNSFTEGFRTPDLTNAKALLDQLS